MPYFIKKASNKLTVFVLCCCGLLLKTWIHFYTTQLSANLETNYFSELAIKQEMKGKKKLIIKNDFIPTDLKSLKDINEHEDICC